MLRRTAGDIPGQGTQGPDLLLLFQPETAAHHRRTWPAIVRTSAAWSLYLIAVLAVTALGGCRTEEAKKAESTPKVIVHAEPIMPAGQAGPSEGIKPTDRGEAPGPSNPDMDEGAGRPRQDGAGSYPADVSVLGPRPLTPGFLPDFASIYERAAPSVVKVQTYRSADAAPFAMGTGFFFGEAGDVVTNAHVVRNAQRFGVTLADGREVPARLVGADPHTDIALLHLEGENLPRPLPPAPSDSVRTGDWVLAIGNPLGLDFSASRGIVSALNRTDVLPDVLGYWDFIQTDAAINVGNSGGPLLDCSGSVVGVAAAVEKQADRIGFAIPIATAEVVTEHLRRYGVLKRSWLGIEIIEVKGKVQVYGVRPDSPAGRAGLQPGDEILALDDIPVTDRTRFRWQVATHPLDPPARLRLLRQGQEREVSVQLDAAPDLHRVDR
ncbi:MAG: PDZ domain-containing protein [Deltaproteobacteria bacterium]|nr:PDZ domain-containing protein [Deltaproteobacteria bacterium]